MKETPPSSSPASFLIPRIADILFAVILLYISVFAGSTMLADGDTGYHIRAGELMLQGGSVLDADPFSHILPQLHWTTHEWLAEVVMALLHHAGGMNAVVVFYSLIIAATIYLFFMLIGKNSGHILAVVPIALIVIACSRIHWLARPHVFSMLFYVIWYWLIDRYNSGKSRHLYLLPVTMVLWVNLHGGYIIGLILLGIYGVGNVLDRWSAGDAQGKAAATARAGHFAVVFLLCVAALLLNPTGYRILLFPFTLVSDGYVMDHVSEFLSPDFHKAGVLRGLILFIVAAVALSPRRLTPTELILLLFFLNMGLYAIRYIPLFALFSAPIVIRQLSPLVEKACERWGFLGRRGERLRAVDGAAKGFLWPVAAVAAVAVMWMHGSVSHGFDPKTKPVAAIEFLRKEKLTGNMYNNDEFGDILIYQAPGEYKVFIDGRLDMYGAERMKEYSRVRDFEQGWEEVLKKYGMTWVFFDADAPLSRHLLLDRQWHLVYADSVANIFVKNIPEHRRLIEKYPNVRPVPKERSKQI